MPLTRFERARVLGARALQISMGAPLLVEATGMDPLRLAIAEMDSGLLPIQVQRALHARD